LPWLPLTGDAAAAMSISPTSVDVIVHRDSICGEFGSLCHFIDRNRWLARRHGSIDQQFTAEHNVYGDAASRQVKQIVALTGRNTTGPPRAAPW